MVIVKIHSESHSIFVTYPNKKSQIGRVLKQKRFMENGIKTKMSGHLNSQLKAS